MVKYYHVIRLNLLKHFVFDIIPVGWLSFTIKYQLLTCS